MVAWVLRFVPYVRMVGLNGSMVTGWAREESDIDFLIIVKPGHIFLGRILTTAVTHLTGYRRHGNHVAGRICLNRYATADYLHIGPENAYHARVFHNLVPLFSTGRAYTRYLRANGWMAKEGYPLCPHEPVLQDSWASRMLRTFGEILLHPCAKMLERYCRKWQRARLNAEPLAEEPGSRIILSDNELCFHLVKIHHGQ